MQRILEKLGAYKMVSGRTMESIASELSITSESLRAKLRGESEFKMSELWILADMIGCSLDELVGREYVA